MNEALRKKRQLGLIVFAGLIGLDIFEFGVGTLMPRGNLIPLAILMIPQAWLIVRYFMHVHELKSGDVE